MKICKDGRIWGQTNKGAGDHLGLLSGKKGYSEEGKYIRKGHNPNSKGRPFKKGYKVSPEELEKRKKMNKLDKNPNWKGGISFEPYSVNWTETFKRAIRERDHYTCQLCGELQGDIAFDVHHIDYDKKNCDPQNLITLCHSCHSKTNYNREYWQSYFTGRY